MLCRNLFGGEFKKPPEVVAHCFGAVCVVDLVGAVCVVDLVGSFSIIGGGAVLGL